MKTCIHSNEEDLVPKGVFKPARKRSEEEDLSRQSIRIRMNVAISSVLNVTPESLDRAATEIVAVPSQNFGPGARDLVELPARNVPLPFKCKKCPAAFETTYGMSLHRDIGCRT